MASKTDHLTQWERNRAFARTIDEAYPDWIATSIFYAAVHVVQALLTHDGVFVDRHDRRNQTLKRIRRYEEIWRNYRPLFDLSIAVRYECPSPGWVSLADIRSRYAPHLYRIEASAFKLMGLKRMVPPIWT